MFLLFVNGITMVAWDRRLPVPYQFRATQIRRHTACAYAVLDTRTQLLGQLMTTHAELEAHLTEFRRVNSDESAPVKYVVGVLGALTALQNEVKRAGPGTINLLKAQVSVSVAVSGIYLDAVGVEERNFARKLWT